MGAGRRHEPHRTGGSAGRLFGLIYMVGIVVTVFLSNDATAVVLTPRRRGRRPAATVERPLPNLFICDPRIWSLIPVTGPGCFNGCRALHFLRCSRSASHMPCFDGPNAGIEAVRGGRRDHSEALERVQVPCNRYRGTAGVSLLASAVGLQLGMPTCMAGLVTLGVVCLTAGSSPTRFLRLGCRTIRAGGRVGPIGCRSRGGRRRVRRRGIKSHQQASHRTHRGRRPQSANVARPMSQARS